MQTKTKNISKLILLVFIFVIPIVISWVLYFFHDNFHLHTTNYGTLVRPAIHSTEFASTTDKWQIVYAPQNCAEDKLMFTLHQLRIALGKNSERVALTLASNQQCANENAHDFQKIILNDAKYASFKNKIYLVDPLGNVFMYYATTTNPMNILKDLQKVLEVSQIG